MITFEVLSHYLAKPDETIELHTEALLKCLEVLRVMGYVNDTQYKILKDACFYHDVGKINPRFQLRLRDHKKFDEKKEISHNVLSIYFIDPEKKMERTHFHQVLYAVLNHHHYVNPGEIFRNQKELLISNLNDILDSLSSKFENQLFAKTEQFYNRIGSRILNVIDKKKTSPEYIITKGLLHKCDYAASAHIPIEFANDFTLAKLEQLATNFVSGWNDLQYFCRQNSDDNLIVVAPTGMGKTEASLLWLGDHKGFYVLPLRTAINSMYSRLKTNWLGDENIDERLALLHGDSLDYYIKEGEDNAITVDADPYYRNSLARNLSLPLTVTTPDQIFDFVFKYLGHERKLATLSYSKVIIDEIQAYSADVLCYVIYGLQMINKLGGKFSIFTATLPPFFKDLLAPSNALVTANSINQTISYKTKTFTHDTARHHINVINTPLTAQDVYDKYQVAQQRDDVVKALVICNTVKKAQQMFADLLDFKIEDVEVKLLHAKFIKRHRAAKEAAILADGATYLKDGQTLNKRAVIWVTTQLVEASLDIDFDLLFTELSELSGLFQRLGRCNRKGVKSTEFANCHVYTTIDSKHLKTDSDRGFIDKGIYQLSCEALDSFKAGVILEADKQNLIDNWLTLENLQQKNSYFIKEYKMHYEFVDSLLIGEINDCKSVPFQNLFRNILAYKIIPIDIYQQNEAVFERAKADWKQLDSVAQNLLNQLKNSSISQADYQTEKSKLKLAKRKIKAEIDSYTLTIAHYQYEKALGKEQFELSKYDNIPVYICHYDEQIGFSAQQNFGENPDNKPEKVSTGVIL